MPRTEPVTGFSDEETPAPKPATALGRKRPAVLVSSSDEDDEKDGHNSIPAAHKPVASTTLKPRLSTASSIKASHKKLKRDDSFELNDVDSGGDEEIDNDDLVPQENLHKSRGKNKVSVKTGALKESAKGKGKTGDADNQKTTVTMASK
jgi:replication factor C subunit 1